MTEALRRWGFWGLVSAIALYGALNLLASIQAIGTAFPGFALHPNMTVTWRIPADWTGPAAGILPTDRVLAVAGRPVSSSAEVYAGALRVPPGTPLTYAISRERWDGERRTLALTVPTQVLSPGAWASGYFVFWLSALAYWAIGVAVSLLKPKDLAARLHLGLCLSFAMVGFGHFDGTHAAHVMPNAGYVAALFTMGACFLGLALVFPRAPWPRHTGRLLRANAAVAAGLCTLALAALFVAGGRFAALSHLLTLLYAFPATLAPALTALWAVRSQGSSPFEKSQSAIILWAAGLSFQPSGWLYLVAYLGYTPPWAAWLELSLILLPLGVAYAIARHRLFAIDWVVQRSALYAILAGALAALYFLVVALARALWGPHETVGAVLAAAAVAVGFAPLRERLALALERHFFRAPYDFEAVVSGFVAEAHEATTPDALEAAYWARVEGALAPAWAARSVAGAWAPRFVREGELPAPDLAAIPPGALRIPFASEDEPEGALLVGPRRAGLPYGERDRRLLEVLTRQLALSSHLLARIEAEGRVRREAEALAEAKAAQDRFLDLVSHELRAPLAVAQGSADVLERHLGPAADALARKHLMRIRRAGRTLAGLVNDLLDAAQLRAGRFEVRGGRFAPGELAGAALDELQPLAQEAGVRLTLAFEGEARASVPGDEGRVAQILRNLLANAIRHTPEDGHVALSVRRAGPWLELAVADTGSGVSPEVAGRLFERFATSGGGVGLGLYIARGIAEAHGGTIAHAPEPAGGSRFTVRLPAEGGREG